MVKINHISILEVVCKKNSYIFATPAIELISIVEKYNTLITISCICGGVVRTSQLRADARGRHSAPQEKKTLSAYRGVETFKYLGRILYRSDSDWPAALQNFGKDHRFWNRRGGAALEGGVTATSVRHFLSRSDSDSPPFWGGGLGFIRVNVQESGDGTYGFPKADNRVEVGATVGRDLATGGSREGP